MHECVDVTFQEPDGASRAITLLIGKVQSQNEPVALRAIHVMDQCSKYCGRPFQTQVGKFKFLNELIKLVSPKVCEIIKASFKILYVMFEYFYFCLRPQGPGGAGGGGGPRSILRF